MKASHVYFSHKSIQHLAWTSYFDENSLASDTSRYIAAISSLAFKSPFQLVVIELEKWLVLLRKFVVENFVELFSNLFLVLLYNSPADHVNLCQSEQRLIFYECVARRWSELPDSSKICRWLQHWWCCAGYRCNADTRVCWRLAIEFWCLHLRLYIRTETWHKLIVD